MFESGRSRTKEDMDYKALETRNTQSSVSGMFRYSKILFIRVLSSPWARNHVRSSSHGE